MALIKCGECGKEISDKASACPGCGSPVQGSGQKVEVSNTVTVSRSGAKWEGIGFVLIVLGIVTGIAGGGGVAGAAIAVGFVLFLIGRFN